ncbi:AlpA family phage regulatory protein [Citrobacter freundii]|nr:AlpA family phage regulatory protein [Citrobacter freundii]MBA7873869.1 AlpA family phage regulatory protein [Citrobacter sp. RHBSTW-00827]MBA7939647.1 AlpA family phage regulatory protein [Citrobacter sp. RHBSTW-00509]QLS97266.1 AlpA family phage regulatory protein [Citrobacter sp. RHBSTW-00859]QLT56654.1 AlpA family phage regulatory protein [Citrobacter sp. RHBSTW-00821]QLU32941.1 AlpA family phage regulatory protein [Citrobacter sp. RHBSTW-00446]QLZ80908.1 AlpA family phage regulatory p
MYRLLKENSFPQSVKIDAFSMVFIESEVGEWINQRLSESRQAMVL